MDKNLAEIGVVAIEIYDPTNLVYCGNPLCTWESLWVLEREGDIPLPLCSQCKDAVEIGQMNEDAEIVSIEMYDETNQ
jgi:hypothetical protein